MARRQKSKKGPGAPIEGGWRFDELPATAQEELLHRMAEADAGRGVFDFDEAIEEDERLTDRILELSHPPAGRTH